MNEMMTSTTEFSWGWIIFLILILWFFVGGGFGGFGYGRNANAFIAGDLIGSANHSSSNCEVERRGLITAAETNYRIIDQAQQTRNVVEATAATTQAIVGISKREYDVAKQVVFRR